MHTLITSATILLTSAAIAQLGERQTEDLKVPGSILGLGMCTCLHLCFARLAHVTILLYMPLALSSMTLCPSG